VSTPVPSLAKVGSRPTKVGSPNVMLTLATVGFAPERRGVAIGIFGAGMGGTAISALTTVKLAEAHGTAAPFIITAIALGAYGLVALALLRDAPGRQLPTEPVTKRLASALRRTITWQASALYAVTFGGYVAFSVYLPTYLKTGYPLTQADAWDRMAGFVLVAVVARPLGGWLSDRFDPVRVLLVVLGLIVVGAAGQATTPGLVPPGTAAFLLMAAALGAGAGAVFALVAQRSPAGGVGAVTGVVGAAGGLGGFVPPLVMGSIYGQYGSYALGLALLSLVAFTAVAYTFVAMRRPVARHA
jgi:NNP family nitrate/nitrite transporter-like MFS transporter